MWCCCSDAAGQQAQTMEVRTPMEPAPQPDAPMIPRVRGDLREEEPATTSRESPAPKELAPVPKEELAPDTKPTAEPARKPSLALAAPAPVKPAAPKEELAPRMKPAAEPAQKPSPAPAVPAPVLTIDFRLPDSTRKTVTFFRRPLGVDFGNSTPIVLKRIQERGHAHQQGVMPGWEVVMVNGEDVMGKDFDYSYGLLRRLSLDLPVTST